MRPAGEAGRAVLGVNEDPRRLISSSSATVRVDQALAWLLTHPAGRPVLVVGATKEAAAHTVREAVRRRGSTVGWRGLTLTRLATTLAQARLIEEGRVPVGTLPLEAI